MPEISIPLALAVAAAGVNYYNTTNTENKQNDALTNEILDQQAAQKQATQAIANQTKAVATSNPAAEQAKATQGFIDQLRTNNNVIAAGDPSQVGNSSTRYAQDAAANSQSASSYANSLANSMASIDAAQRQRTDEQQGFQNTASTVGGIQYNAAQQAFADKLRAQSITQNPWLTLTGQVLKGASTAAGAYYGAAGNAAGVGTGNGEGLADATTGAASGTTSGSNVINPLLNQSGSSSAWADA
jgi:hypothetical protein